MAQDRRRAQGLRVAFVEPFYDAGAVGMPIATRRFSAGNATEVPEPTSAFEPGTSLRLARELAQSARQVGAFQLGAHSARFRWDGVDVARFRSPLPTRAVARWLNRSAPRFGPAYYEPSASLARAVEAWRPDIVHFHGLTLDINLALILRAARRCESRVVVHWHGGLPEAGLDRLTAAIRRNNLSRPDRLLFTHRELARPWFDAGYIRRLESVVELPETSTSLQPVPRAMARARARLGGDPSCLLVGRLEPVKDPVTTMLAFARLAERRPLAQLHVCDLGGGLMPAVRGLVGAMPGLSEKVTFHGRVAPDRMAEFYSGADILLQASRREWSGLAVIEALACGAVPVIADIPAFRALTMDGRYGRLFGVGDARAMADQAASLSPAVLRGLRSACRDHFRRSLSFPALGERLRHLYAEMRV